MAELTSDDKKVIKTLKKIVKGSPAKNRFAWKEASKEDDGAIRLPGTDKRGDALILSLPELQRQTGALMQPGVDVNALAQIDKNQVLIPRLDAEYFKLRMAVDKIAYEAPPAARLAYNYRPLKGPSKKFLDARVSVTINHEVCHIDNRGPYFTSASNSELTCSTLGNAILAKGGHVESRDKKATLNLLAPAGAPDFWAREILIFADGKFDDSMRDVLPGHEKFVESIRARIEQLKYAGPLRGTPQAQTDRNVALRQAIIDSPTKNGHIDSLVKVMSEQLEREYNYLSSTNANIQGGQTQNVDSYVERRIDDFKKYLSGESTTFQMTRYFPTLRE